MKDEFVKTKDGKKIQLPAGVVLSDLKAIPWDSDLNFRWGDQPGIDLEELDIPMWYVEAFGWCMPTLLINRAGRRARMRGVTTDRTYAISTDGRCCRIGHGPHVLAEITVHINKSNIDRLRPLAQLRRSGEVKAHQTRDRISSRRMRCYF